MSKPSLSSKLHKRICACGCAEEFGPRFRTQKCIRGHAARYLNRRKPVMRVSLAEKRLLLAIRTGQEALVTRSLGEDFRLS